MDRYLVIMADRKKARYFTMYLNNFEDLGEEIIDRDMPQRTKTDNARHNKIDRHIQQHLNDHFKHLVTRIKEYLIKRKITRLAGVIIGGHKQLINQIKESLPARLKDKVIGEFVANVDTPLFDLAEKAKAAMIR